MKRFILSLLLLALTPLAVACTGDAGATPMTIDAAEVQIARGKYLVEFGGCHDCHTPSKKGPNGPEPDLANALAGHLANRDGGTNTAFAGPWGVSYAANLTPDEATGLGIWNEGLFLKTMRTGRHVGVSRPILPPMPWENLNRLDDRDLKAIFAYLQSVKPIYNEVPDPVITPASQTKLTLEVNR